MQYAYARCQSILKKANVTPETIDTKASIHLNAPEERALAMQLLRMEEILLVAASDLRPNVITGYLWDLAKAYSVFFQNCPVLKAPPELLPSRLLLCYLVARSLRLGLNLLGIRVIERM
jgi:arginyl-tRNA synthetase